MRIRRRYIITPALWLAVATAVDAQATRRLSALESAPIAHYTDSSGAYLARPGQLALCRDQIAVLDYDRMEVVAFGLDARPRWRFGRRGAGPGEFDSPRDITCDDQGRLWVVDESNARVTIIGATGALDRLIRLETPGFRIALHGHDTSFALVTRDPRVLFTHVSPAGSPSGSVAAPPELASFDLMRREPFLASAGDDGVVVGFRWSSRLFRVSRAGAIAVSVPGLDAIDFPRLLERPCERPCRAIQIVDPDAPEVTQEVRVANGVIYARVATTDDPEARTIDRYAVTDGRYLGSFRLAVTPDAFAIRNDTLILLTSDSVPALQLLRWRNE